LPLHDFLPYSYPRDAVNNILQKLLVLTFFATSFLAAYSNVKKLEESTFKSSQIEFYSSTNNKLLKAQKIFSHDLGQGNFSWNGKLTNGEEGLITFTKIKGTTQGTVRFKGGQTYSLGTTNAGAVFFSPKKQTSQRCAGCEHPNKSSPIDPRTLRRAKNWRNGDGNLVDLLVAYTSDARISLNFNTENEIKAYIQNAVSESNLCFINSKVNCSIRLVHVVEVEYNETQNPSLDLNRSVDQADGYLDDLHSLRDQYGADLVTLLVSKGDGSLGGIAKSMAYPSLDFESSGFNVVVMDQIGAPNYSLLHEIGHNMGCLHNREDAMNRGIPETDPSNNSVFKAFNYGKRWLVDGEGYRTIMSYDTEGTLTYSNRIPYFSNPNIEYQGISTGNIDSEDNAQVLNTTAPYVSNFRDSVIQQIVPSLQELTVEEGNASSVTIRLASKLDQNMTITAGLDSNGDQDFLLFGSGTLTFSPTNWNLPQTLQIYSTADLDNSAGTSTLYLSASGIPTASVLLTEIDAGSLEEDKRIISGVVQNSLGVGVENVKITLASGEIFKTDEKGSFIISLESGWTGTLTLNKTGYSISPSSLSITAEASGKIDQLFSASRSDILYVDAEASGNMDGSSWANAYQDLSIALESIHPFTEIWVKKGTYKPGNFRSDFFLLPPNVSIFGGFDGTETERIQKNPAVNETILSGDIGITGDGSDNSFHIVVPSAGSHLEGFTIQDGNATENFSDSRGKGAGLHAKGVTFSISECIFKNNRARQNGGAIYGEYSIINTTSCTFSDNKGGAIFLSYCELDDVNSSFQNNSADSSGGAIDSQNSNLSLTGTSFYNNQVLSTNGGGAIYLYDGELNLTQCVFSLNLAPLNGGAIYAQYAEVNSSQCLFSSNQNTSNNGGGAITLKFCTMIDGNSTLSYNSSASNGGALYASDSNLTLTKSHFSNNTSSYSGGGLYAARSEVSTSGNYYSQNSADSYGGGVFINNSTWNETLAQYSENNSSYNGGGLCLEDSNGSIIDSNFTSNLNLSYNGGGGLSLENSSPQIEGCKFLTNSTISKYGGAIYMSSGSSPAIYNCSFIQNKAVGTGGYGGALYFFQNSSVEINKCLFSENSAYSGGAFTAWDSSDLNFTNCRFTGNEANASSESNGGVCLLGGTSNRTFFMNCLLANNHANQYGGVIRAAGTTRFLNCTLSANSADSYGGISILFNGNTLAFENSILWANTAGIDGADIFVNGENVTASFCIFDPSNSSSSISGTSNLNMNPLFVNANGEDGISGNEDDDFSLQSNSPAIDQANSSALYYSTTDILAKTRYGSGPDIGAYEYRINSAPVINDGSSYSFSSEEDQVVSYTFSASDSDADDLAWAITTNASNAIVSINSETGQVSYLPNPHWSGTDSFVIAVSDGTASSSISITATVIAVNDPLLVTNQIADQTLQEDNPNLSIDLSSIFYDPDGDTLTYSVESSNESLVSASVQDKNLTLSLALNQFGLATITLSASSDGESISTSFELVVNAVNDSPAFDNLNQQIKIDIDEHIPILDVYDFNASDQDTDSLIYSVTGVDADNFEIHASTGSLAFKESPDYENPLDADRNNTYSLTVLVTDPSEASDAINVTIYVNDTDEFAWATNSTLSGPWKSSDWFGTYYENVNNWIYHIDHGWLYREGDSMLSTWFYDQSLKWLWTSHGHYPLFYNAETNDWMYYLLEDLEIRKFYDYASQSWMTVLKN
jgi:predicted outer membrane repeat protein